MNTPGIPQSHSTERAKYTVSTQNRGGSSNATKTAATRDLPGKTEVVRIIRKDNKKRIGVTKDKPLHINVPTRGAGGANKLEYLRPQNNRFNTLSAEALNMAKAQAAIETTARIVDGTFGFLNKYLVSSPVQDKPGNNKMGDGLGNIKIQPKSNDYSGRIGTAKSFQEINSVESDMKNAKAGFKNSYSEMSNTIQSEVGKILTDDIKTTLKDAGVKLDTNSIKLSDLPDISDSANFEEALNTIDADIAKMDNFANSLTAATTSVTSKKGMVDQELASLQITIDQLPDGDPQKAELIKKKTQLEKKKQDLETAANAIKSLQGYVVKNKGTLETKKSEINNLKDADGKIKDKKYDLAKTQDKQLKQIMDQINKLNKEIKKCTVDKNPNKTDKSDANRMTKHNNLVSQRTQLYTELGEVMSSLNTVANVDIKNSKGDSYKITNLSAANSFVANKAGLDE